MFEVTCVLECRVVPVKLAKPAMNRGVAVADRADVTFKVAVVRDVEADLDAD